MIRIVEIHVSGVSGAGKFSGSLSFSAGLQVVSADNHFGKSLAATAVPWCLGLEPMFGLQDNDPSRFPIAVRDEIELEGAPSSPVYSSQASLVLARGDGAHVRLTRDIKGSPEVVSVSEMNARREVERTSTLQARRNTLKDAVGGLQNFLFTWCGMPRFELLNIRGDSTEIYLENLAPLFFIDQNEGWTDLQAQQVRRYGTLEISDAAVEYLLGASLALDGRKLRQRADVQQMSLKAEARVISERIETHLRRHGWVASWSDHGRVTEIAQRWSREQLEAWLLREAGVDVVARLKAIGSRIDRLQDLVAKGAIDSTERSATSDGSQAVIELKERRHTLRAELRVLGRQAAAQSELLHGLEHRCRSAKDVLRLKREGIGRIEQVECPTCHRTVAAETFQLDSQSGAAVEAHIDALERDRRLVKSNLASVRDQETRTAASLETTERALREAEVALRGLNSTIGSSREQLVKAAAELQSSEGELQRWKAIGSELADSQASVDAWLKRAAAADPIPGNAPPETHARFGELVNRLGVLLAALGHSALKAQPAIGVRIDDHYVPYLGSRRLRSLGSASDQARLVAAYVLALAAASEAKRGFHPGFVVLDEPLQQNPDPSHRELFVKFLCGPVARDLRTQTIVFTSLLESELDQLGKSGTRVVRPVSTHFLAKEPAGA